MEGCDNEMQCPGTGTCKNCYQSILNWSKRSAEDIERRANNIGLYSNRMNVLAPAFKKTMTPKKIKLRGMPGQIKYKLAKKTNGKRK
jgi:hypothetical protein